MGFLTEDDRAKLLKQLALAPDDVLLEAVANQKSRYHHEQRLWEEVRGYAGAKAPRPTAEEPARNARPESEPGGPAAEETENQEPPGEACTRIGSENREAIMVYCKKPRSHDEIKKHTGIRKLEPLLKLLWERGELTYDGESFQCA